MKYALAALALTLGATAFASTSEAQSTSFQLRNSHVSTWVKNCKPGQLGYTYQRLPPEQGGHLIKIDNCTGARQVVN